MSIFEVLLYMFLAACATLLIIWALNTYNLHNLPSDRLPTYERSLDALPKIVPDLTINMEVTNETKTK